jgi:FkbM family methyltransferase
MFLDTDEPQQRQVYWTGIYDRVAVETLTRYLPDGGVLVDVGAGVGSICLFALKACINSGKNVTVHAFEPMGLNYDRLVRNTSLNDLAGQVSCHKVALGAERGALNLCFRGGAGAAAVVQTHPEISLLAGQRMERASVETLNEWVTDHELSRLDVLKVDIEGAEPLMFRGAIRTIERFLPVILAEFNHWWAQHHGFSIAEHCFEPLWDLGYRAFRQDSYRRSWKQVSGRPAAGPSMEDTLWIPPGRSLAS